MNLCLCFLGLCVFSTDLKLDLSDDLFVPHVSITTPRWTVQQSTVGVQRHDNKIWSIKSYSI